MSEHPLRKWLYDHGRTAASFADEIGVTPSALSYWFSYTRWPSRDSMLAVFEATDGGVTPAQMTRIAQRKGRRA